MRSLDSLPEIMAGRSGFRPAGYTRGAPWAAVIGMLALSWAPVLSEAEGRVEGRPIAAQPQVDHTAWDTLLRRYVNKAGFVDYASLKTPEGLSHYFGPKENAPGWSLLADYLEELKHANVAGMPSKEEQLAFWINAYNANVVKGVLDHDPLASVKEAKGFFDRIRYRVAGRDLTLNEIEGAGRALGDWRIHFAVVCASSSCPLLRAEAYVADRLEAQLAEQTRQFLDNPQRGLRIEDGTLWASNIFDWYTTDFIPAKELGLFRRLTPEKLLSVLAPYLRPEVGRAVRHRTLELRFMDYDWSLNARRP